jgi:chromosome segregation ATPase
LTKERARLDKVEADDPVGATEDRLKIAEDAVRNIEGLEKNLETAEANLKAAKSAYELAESRLDQRQRSREEAEKASQELTDLKGKESDAQESVNTAQAAFDDATQSHNMAKESLERAQNEALIARRLVDLLRRSEELKAAKARFNKANNADQLATDLTAKANANPFTPNTLAELRRLDGEARDAETRLNAIATGLELSPDKGRHATIDGKKIGEKTIILTKPTRIKLDGFGAIRVTPGGEDIASRREEAVTAANELKKELEVRGAGSLQDAEQQGSNRLSQINEAKTYRKTMEAYAPKGLDALRCEVAEFEAQINRLKEDLDDTEIPKITTDKAEDRADKLGGKFKHAEAEERRASDNLKDAEGALQAAKKSLADAIDRGKVGEDKLKDIRKTLDRSEREEGDEDLKNALKAAAKASEDASTAVNDIKQTLAKSDPDGARRELDAATEARDKVEKNLQDLRRQIRDLEVELQTLGQGNTAAELEVAKGRLERAQATEARLSHEAAALTLLHETLIGAEQSARETFLGPVSKRVEPYLRRLFPDSELVLNDQTLEITHLRRNGQDEPYERLSIGAREQLAVLARLAFADLLNEHGKQSPVILDDALVFSDDSRFEEMQRILDRAAERLQIVVLTCHERAFFGRGWATKRLRECNR